MIRHTNQNGMSMAVTLRVVQQIHSKSNQWSLDFTVHAWPGPNELARRHHSHAMCLTDYKTVDYGLRHRCFTFLYRNDLTAHVLGASMSCFNPHIVNFRYTQAFLNVCSEFRRLNLNAVAAWRIADGDVSISIPSRRSMPTDPNVWQVA